MEFIEVKAQVQYPAEEDHIFSPSVSSARMQ